MEREILSNTAVRNTIFISSNEYSFKDINSTYLTVVRSVYSYEQFLYSSGVVHKAKGDYLEEEEVGYILLSDPRIWYCKFYERSTENVAKHLAYMLKGGLISPKVSYKVFEYICKDKGVNLDDNTSVYWKVVDLCRKVIGEINYNNNLLITYAYPRKVRDSDEIKYCTYVTKSNSSMEELLNFNFAQYYSDLINE